MLISCNTGVVPQVHAARVVTLGDDALETLQAMTGLVTALAGQDRFDEAIFLCRQAVKIQTKVLGSRSPETLRTRMNLATLLGHDTGELCQVEEAEKVRWGGCQRQVQLPVRRIFCIG